MAEKKYEKTYDFFGDVVVEKIVVEIVGFIDVKAGVDFDFEVLSICVVQGPFSLVQLESLTFLSPEQSVVSVLITYWRLKQHKV